MSKDSYSVLQLPSTDLPGELINLIRSKWMRSLRYGHDLYKLMSPPEYYDWCQGDIDDRLGDMNTNVRFAVLTDDHDVVLGFSVYCCEVLYYVYVHKDNRRLGISKFLIPSEVTHFTELTKTGMFLWKKYKRLNYNPFL